MVTEHAATALMFGICKGGCRNVDNQSGTATGQYMCRIYRIAVIRVLVMMLPKIFRNGNPYLKSIQFSGFKNFIGFKVSQFVKNIIGRDQGFMKHPDDLTMAGKYRTIVHLAAIFFYCRKNRSKNQGGLTGRFSNLPVKFITTFSESL